MIIAGILFLLGILIGLSYHYIAVIAASLVTVVAMSVLWLALGAFGALSPFLLLGYLFALQSGYLVGAYLRPEAGEPSPEQDHAAGDEAQSRPPGDGDGDGQDDQPR